MAGIGTLAAGSRVGDYVLEGLIAEGGMGAVYRARDDRLGRIVALKILSDSLAADPSFRGRFADESRIAAALDHPNVVPIYEAGESDGRLFIAMRLVDGVDLGTLVARDGPLDPGRTIDLLRGIAGALDAAHERGLVHRDVKPDNILVTATGDRIHAYLADFGLTRERGGDRGRTITGQFAGSVDYAAPEQIRGEAVEPAADIYSLACVAHACLTGTPPFARPTEVATLFAHLNEPPPSLRESRATLAPLDEPMRRGLAKRSIDRPPSALAFIEALAAATTAGGTAGSDGGPEEAIPGLPAEATSFLGRDRDVGEIGARLAELRLMTLTGPGGVGKTRLAARVAVSMAPAYPGGTHFLELAPVADAGLVPSALAGLVGVGQEAGATLEDVLIRSLGSGRRLLVLDNIEHVVEAGPFVARLLEACPNLTILATGRRGFHLSVEHEYRVDALVVPEPKADLDEILESATVRLFVDRARSIRPDLRLSPDEARDVAAICGRLDGLPLAIELAAARIRVLGPAAILRRLDSRLGGLGGGPADAPDRHRALRATIAWSEALLAEPERRAFRRVAAFTGGWTLEAFEAVLGAIRDDGDGDRDAGDGESGHYPDPLDLLETLADHSLVRANETANGEPRFNMLETIREYARDQLEAAGEVAPAVAAHGAYFCEFADTADVGLRGNDQQAWLARLTADYPNVLAALRWSIDAAPDLCLRMAVSMWWFWDLRGDYAEGRDWLQRALERDETAPPDRRAAALNGIGALAEGQGDVPGARVALTEGIALRRALGDDRGLAVILNNLGIVERDVGNTDEAEAAWLESVAIFERLGQRSRVAIVSFNLGILARDRGDFAEAARLYETGLAFDREQNDLRGVSADLNNLGLVALHAGDLGKSAALFLESLSLKRSFGDRSGAAEVIEGLAGVAGRVGDALLAARFYGAADAIRTAIGAPLNAPERGPYEAYVAEARALIEAERFDDARADGRRLDFDAAVEEAIGWAQGMTEEPA